LSDSAMAIPGVSDRLQPIVDEIRAKLTAVVSV
jgi:hypothetical protein